MSSYEKELIVQGKYTTESFCLEEAIYLIKKDDEELVKVIGYNVAQKILKD